MDIEHTSIFSLLKHNPPPFSIFTCPSSSHLKTGTASFHLSFLSTSSRFRQWNFTVKFVKTPPKSNFPFQFSDRDDNDDGADDDDYDYGDKSSLPWDERFVRGLDKFTDTVFIFKVFKSYGWFLPPILLSLLLTSGLKAFLLALAPALGLSALYLAFESLVGPIQMNTNRTVRRPKKQAKRVRMRARKRKMGYQSWVKRNSGSVDKNISQDEPSFNGWDDELDSPRSYSMGSMQKTAETKSELSKPLIEEEKLARSGEKSETLLLLRLLLAVFPFLGSWIKLLM